MKPPGPEHTGKGRAEEELTLEEFYFDLLERCVPALDAVLEHYVDVDRPYEGDHEREVHRSAEQVLREARQAVFISKALRTSQD